MANSYSSCFLTNVPKSCSLFSYQLSVEKLAEVCGIKIGGKIKGYAHTEREEGTQRTEMLGRAIIHCHFTLSKLLDSLICRSC